MTKQIYIYENEEFKDVKNYAKEQKKGVDTLMDEINTGKHDCELIRFKNKDYDIDDVGTSKNLNRLQAQEIIKLNDVINKITHSHSQKVKKLIEIEKMVKKFYVIFN
jgi:translation initiation factor 2B subunit (eIF-2B alpha/beta/delta family)